MRALPIVAPPLDNAFAKAAAERIRVMLERRGIEVDMIDLYADDFDPRLTGAASLSVLAHMEDLAARGLVATEGEPSIGGTYRLTELPLPAA